MLDLAHVSTTAIKTEIQSQQAYDLIVIGAGVAGLNALYAATQYLSKDARVLLLDQKPKAGGMWNTAYDYVRLHQPHGMFTVGDMSWDWRKPRSYLAARDEVQAHLESALHPVEERIKLETRFGVTAASCDEVMKNGRAIARVSLYPNDAPEKLSWHYADRVIHASGLDYHEAKPMEFQSDAVLSIVPSELNRILGDNPRAPVIVVGGGKTGMDTALAALNDNRSVTLIKGRGTIFVNRDKAFPSGAKRWTGGYLFTGFFRDIALRFDGTNEAEVLPYLRETYGTDPSANDEVFLYGLLSEKELARLKQELSQSIDGYLETIVDSPDGPRMRMRDGTSHPVEPGTIILNCGGSFFRTEKYNEARPLVSPHGTVVNINARDSFTFLTSIAAFFVTHLLYRNLLSGSDFYTLDSEMLFRENRDAWVGATAAQTYMNLAIAAQRLPLSVLMSCGLNFDRWYPLPRLGLGLLKIKARARSDAAKCRYTLDQISQRFDVKCGPII